MSAKRWLRTGASAALAAGCMIFSATRCGAQCSPPFALSRTFNNPTPASSERFGNSVAVSGNLVLVGARNGNAGASNAGNAYLFEATTGALLRTFTNPTPQSDDQFGSSVAIDGNYAVIGAISDNTGATDAGSAYLFDVSTGALLRTFNNPTPEIGDWSSFPVAISGNNVLMASAQDDAGGSSAGSVYLFNAASGALVRTFSNPTPAGGDLFGIRLAIEGNNVLIGAYQDDTGASDAGSAYLFDAASGALLRTFNDPTPQNSGYFGSAVAISGNNVLVGAYWDNGAGSAFLFDATTGALIHTFNNPTPGGGEAFGFAAAMTPSIVVVGDFSNNSAVADVGGAYLFDAATGALIQTFSNPTPASSDEFGISVAISGSVVVVGAHDDDTGANNAGSAYLYGCPPNAAVEWALYQ